MQSNGLNALTYLFGTLLDLYITAIMLRVLLQWVRADFYNPVCQFLVKLTNPPLLPLRRVIPAIGRLDTATVVLMLALEILNIYEKHNIDDLIVVDEKNRVIGAVDIQDMPKLKIL